MVTSVGGRSGPARQDAAGVLSALGLTSRTLADAGHLAPLEAPEAFADLVRSLPAAPRGDPMTAPTTVRGTDPYPWPYAGLPATHRIALVVAGADAHWIARCPAPAARLVATQIASVAAPLRAAGVRVVHVEHDRPRPAAPDVGPPAVSPTSLREHDDLTVAAGGIDGFYGSTLDRRLRDLGCDHLLVCGFGLEAPVHSTHAPGQRPRLRVPAARPTPAPPSTPTPPTPPSPW